ncbi:unnamed protein product (macronuclear) [Paramecium tetraurelia]|uniref:PAS domain-containing protein n=1 Tax=Paramecium tetraurelia TaxID=5888 RepID=A0DFS5_PARTE|nr:uncharacterized protein GSPATT00016705001 [Paramecium tetraurelia]CAK81892.1 unnamed protein product [Paramecium tetraurelia]|eukprot:XP_001449289.1 hypothetical protein (macronuclear) [Paramecium tetraurelia strain d4-2]
MKTKMKKIFPQNTQNYYSVQQLEHDNGSLYKMHQSTISKPPLSIVPSEANQSYYQIIEKNKLLYLDYYSQYNEMKFMENMANLKPKAEKLSLLENFLNMFEDMISCLIVIQNTLLLIEFEAPDFPQVYGYKPNTLADILNKDIKVSLSLAQQRLWRVCIQNWNINLPLDFWRLCWRPCNLILNKQIKYISLMSKLGHQNALIISITTQAIHKNLIHHNQPYFVLVLNDLYINFIMQLTKNPNQNHLQYHTRSNSLNKSCSSKQPSANLPILLRQQTTFANHKINNENESSVANQNTEILGDFLLPSHNYTKQQNMILADELTEKVSSLRNNTNLNVVKQMVRKRVKTYHSDLENSVNSTQRLITDPGIVAPKKSNNNQYLIDREQVSEDGVKFPFRLFMMNKRRQNLISQLLTNTNINNIGHDSQNELEKKDLAERLMAQIKTTQEQKSKKALTSKSYMNNAFYSLLALKKHSQEAVKLKYRQNLPKDSRFYLI